MGWLELVAAVGVVCIGAGAILVIIGSKRADPDAWRDDPPR